MCTAIDKTSFFEFCAGNLWKDGRVVIAPVLKHLTAEQASQASLQLSTISSRAATVLAAAGPLCIGVCKQGRLYTVHGIA